MSEIYICTDIEADGPSPGHYSMLSFASVAFQLDKTILGTFERNLELLPNAKQHPETMEWWKTEPEAWNACRENTIAPKQAMEEYTKWLETFEGIKIFVAHPVSFYYSFIAWYLHEFTGKNPFFIGGLDIASYAMALSKQPFSKSHKPYMPEKWIDTEFPLTHKAIDDAMSHAMTFCNIYQDNKNSKG